MVAPQDHASVTLVLWGLLVLRAVMFIPLDDAFTAICGSLAAMRSQLIVFWITVLVLGTGMCGMAFLMFVQRKSEFVHPGSVAFHFLRGMLSFDVDFELGNERDVDLQLYNLVHVLLGNFVLYALWVALIYRAWVLRAPLEVRRTKGEARAIKAVEKQMDSRIKDAATVATSPDLVAARLTASCSHLWGRAWQRNSALLDEFVHVLSEGAYVDEWHRKSDSLQRFPFLTEDQLAGFIWATEPLVERFELTEQQAVRLADELVNVEWKALQLPEDFAVQQWEAQKASTDAPPQSAAAGQQVTGLVIDRLQLKLATSGVGTFERELRDEFDGLVAEARSIKQQQEQLRRKVRYFQKTIGPLKEVWIN